MKFFSVFLLFSTFSWLNIAAQTKTYEVLDFSDKYGAKVIVSEIYDENNYEDILYISIFDKKTSKELFREEFHLDISDKLDGGDTINSNIVELPYNEQNVVVYDDFNCDGEPDLAIKIDNLSCYSHLAYNVYISKDGQLKLHDEFSRLAQEYCGFFQHDCDKKEIYTMTKSGCCWHQYSTFDIVRGNPVIREIVEENTMEGSYSTRTIKTYINGKEDIKVYPLFDYSELIFSFVLDKNGKQAVVYLDPKGVLVYLFLTKEGEAEFDFSGDFYLKKKDGKDILTFSNESAEYEIYSNKTEAGIIVKTNGKTYQMKGDVESIVNSLNIFYNTEDTYNLQISNDLE